MQGFVIKCSSRKNLKQIGDKIILNLIEKGLETKYRVLGNYIFLETKGNIDREGIVEAKIYSGKIDIWLNKKVIAC